MKNLLRLLGILYLHKKWVFISILFGFATIASGIGLMGTSAYLISTAALRPSIAVLQVAIVGVRFFGISRGVFRYLERLVSHAANLRILSDLRKSFFEALEPIVPSRSLEYQSGDLLARVTADVEILEYFFIRVAAPVIVAVVVTVGMSLFMGLFDPSLAWILFAGLIISGVSVPLLSRSIRKQKQSSLIQSRAQLSTAITENIQGLRDLIAFDRQATKKQQVETHEDRYHQSQTELIWRESLVESLNVFFPNATLWLTLFAAIPLVAAGGLEGTLLAVVALIALASFEAVQPLGIASQNLELSQQAADRLFSLQAIEPEVKTPENPLPLNGLNAIELKNLCFRYEPGENWTLQDISFRLLPNQRIAIVGASGAGKTTIFNLLLRLWDTGQDQIFINGEDIRKYHPQQVRKLFSTVSQRGHLFNRSLRDNLQIANPDVSDEVLIDTLQKVGLDDWYGTLSSGLNTWLGEHGAKVSGGEKQRILIARALLHAGPVWLLDEPTVHFDIETEKAITNLLLQQTAQRSSLWIQHRLIAMDKMDEILVLHEGLVVERGDHLSLLQKGGFYTFLWNEQHRKIVG